MILNLSIKNFVLINELNISFPHGLITITGETGAGKSIILGALKLLLGERADIKSILNTENKCSIEGTFLIKDELKDFFLEHDLDFEKETLIRREILSSGKSRAFINDSPVTLDILQELGNQLVDIHSQFDTQQVLNPEFQIKILDAFVGNKELLATYQLTYKNYNQLKTELKKAEIILENSAKDSDYKDYLLKELNEIELEKINFQELENQLNELSNADLIKSILSEIYVTLSQDEIGLRHQINSVESKLNKISGLTQSIQSILDKTILIKENLFDVEKEINNLQDYIDNNPEQLLIIQNQVDTINKLMDKHQVKSIEELIEIKHKLSSENENFDHLREKIIQLKSQISEKQNILEELSQKLNHKRIENKLSFEKHLIDLLNRLGLENANFKIEINSSDMFNEFGTDRIEFLFSANSGVSLQPLKKAISGGERSRVMFAIKKIMAENDNLPTLILDEIDTGVSGRIANEMGKMMSEIGESLQLMAITHLPQIAAQGKTHYKVIKTENQGKTETMLIPLIREERVKEIAGLISGSEITPAAMQQAIALME